MAEDAATFTSAGLRRGARRCLALAAASFVYGIGFGVMADHAGLALGEAVAMSALVYAGASQVVALGMWDDPIPFLAVWLAAIAVNARYLLLGAALRPWLAGLGPGRAYLTLGLISDGTWALALRERAASGRDAAFLVGGGLALWVAWVGSTGLGHALGAVLGAPSALGLDFLLPAFCATIAIALWRGRGDLGPLLAGGGTALAVAALIDGPWYVVAGGAAGCLAAAAGATHDA
ncbi:MAG: AzlC family ABC transporter permease [Alphaproteobacteria bacterium]|nr:AzlC family ABC transporter permease [Alphaproteobacteria bacterium]